MGVGGSSPNLGSASATCLRKFSIHVRNDHTNFQGKYGFDWLRNEYINNIYKVDGLNYAPLFTGNKSDLINVYNSGQISSIAPFGASYSPAWLAIFANTTNKQSTMGSSEINVAGVDLDLEVIPYNPENDVPLQDDGTIIRLESSNKYIIVSPNNFKLKDLIGSRKVRNLDLKNKTKQYFYENLKKINVKCKGGVINRHEEINIYATKNSITEKVGKLMIYKNNDVPKLDLYFIDVITNNQKISKPSNYEYFLKFQSFNQALVRAEKKLETKFDLLSLSKTIPEIYSFIQKVNDPEVINKNKNLDSLYLSNKIIELFDKYGGKYRPKKEEGSFLKINGNGHARTYIFYTDIIAGGTNGIAPPEVATTSNKWEWGNTVVIFKQAQSNADTLVHEIGHSLKLPHIFEKNGGGKFIFHQGLTGNIMDYTWYKTNIILKDASGKSRRDPNGKLMYQNYSNRFKRVYFSKFQWDILRNDRSIK